MVGKRISFERRTVYDGPSARARGLQHNTNAEFVGVDSSGKNICRCLSYKEQYSTCLN